MNALIRRLAVLAATLTTPSFTCAQGTLFSDEMATRNNWFNSSGQNPSGVSATGGVLSVNSGRHVLAYFMPEGTQREIGINETLSLTFDIKFNPAGTNTSLVNSISGFRVGIFDSKKASRPQQLDGTSTGFTSYDGYLVTMNPNPPSGDNSLKLRERKPATATSTLMNSFSSAGFTTYVDALVSGVTSPTIQTFEINTLYQATYSISRGGDTSLTFRFSLTGGNLVDFDFSANVASPTTRIFDSIGLFSVTDTSNFVIDNVNITAVPEPSTYAACAGAAVLGLAFWRRRRAAAQALAA
jgi:hypothetical protein